MAVWASDLDFLPPRRTRRIVLPPLDSAWSRSLSSVLVGEKRMVRIPPSRGDSPVAGKEHSMILRADHREKKRGHPVVISDAVERFPVELDEFPGGLAGGGR
jgi:hypothetical protein